MSVVSVAYHLHLYHYYSGRYKRFSSQDGEKKSITEDDNTDSASYIQTPKPGQKPGEGNLPRLSQSKFI